ncbi:hypothetical protein [Chondrinema litorale]|uniref:hypothetical protein n=1 Tax=Chondrinema litorale TaxID=2994555 RepID=UPI0025432B3E|nr:hypothetical protein [Chondrinema litorale]UZR93164.1 hypothetical protein OQ292_14990 [Chondrinema litorale]
MQTPPSITGIKPIYKPVNSEKQIRLLHHYIKDYNQKHPKLAEQLKPQHMQTAELLFKIAIQKKVVFDKATHLMKVESQEGESFECGTFKGNGAAIAKSLNILPKSLDNHLKRLKKAGIASSFTVPSNGKQIRKGGKNNETLFAINAYFFT